MIKAFDLYRSIILINKTNLAVVKNVLNTKYNRMTTKKEKVELIKMIDLNINGIKRYWKSNTKSKLKHRVKMEEKRS